jgi:hypothetical protein
LVNFVLGLNLIRRHLSTGDKAVIGLNAMPFQAAEAKERQRLAGVGVFHGNRYTGGILVVSPILGQPLEEDTSSQDTDEDTEADDPAVEQKGDLRAAYIAAKAVGIGKSTMQEIIRISKIAPERIEDIKQGRSRGITLLLSLD